MALRRQLPSRIQTDSPAGEAAPAPKVPVTQSVPPIPQLNESAASTSEKTTSVPDTPPAKPVTDLAALGAMLADLPAPTPATPPASQQRAVPVSEPEAQPAPAVPAVSASQSLPTAVPESVTISAPIAPASPKAELKPEPQPVPESWVPSGLPRASVSATSEVAAAAETAQVSKPLPENLPVQAVAVPEQVPVVPAEPVTVTAPTSPAEVIDAAPPSAAAPEEASSPVPASVPVTPAAPLPPSLPDDDNPMRRRPKQPRTFTFNGPVAQPETQTPVPVSAPAALADTTPVAQVDDRLRAAGLLPTPVADELTAGLPPKPQSDLPVESVPAPAVPPAFVPPPPIPAEAGTSVPPILPPALATESTPRVSFDFLPPPAVPVAPKSESSVTKAPPAAPDSIDNENMQVGSASELLSELAAPRTPTPPVSQPPVDAPAHPQASAPIEPPAPAPSFNSTPTPVESVPWLNEPSAATPTPATGGGWGMSWDTPVIATPSSGESPVSTDPAAIPPVPDVFGSQAAGNGAPPPPPPAAPEIMGQNGRGLPVMRGGGKNGAPRGGTWQVGVAAAVVAGALFGAYQLVSRDQSSPLALSGQTGDGAIAIGDPAEPTLLPPPTVSAAGDNQAMSPDVFNAGGADQTSPSNAMIAFADVPPDQAARPVVADGTEAMPEDVGFVARLQQAIAEEKAKKAVGTSDAITGTTSTSVAGVDVATAGAVTDPNDLKAKYAEELEAYRKALAAAPKDAAPTPGQFLKSGGATPAAATNTAMLDSEGAPVSTPNGELLPPPSLSGSNAVPPDELYRNNPKNLPVVPEPAATQAVPVRQLNDFDVAMFTPERDRVRIPQGIKPRFSSGDFPQMDVLSFVPGKGVIAYRDGREGVLLIGESIDGWELMAVNGDNAEFRNGQRSQYVTAD